MKGLRKAIKDMLPQIWEAVLREQKCLGIFIELMYLSIPPDKKGRRLINGKISYKKGIAYIDFMFKNTNIVKCIEPALTKFGSKGVDWNNILRIVNERLNYLR